MRASGMPQRTGARGKRGARQAAEKAAPYPVCGLREDRFRRKTGGEPFRKIRVARCSLCPFSPPAPMPPKKRAAVAEAAPEAEAPAPVEVRRAHPPQLRRWAPPSALTLFPCADVCPAFGCVRCRGVSPPPPPHTLTACVCVMTGRARTQAWPPRRRHRRQCRCGRVDSRAFRRPHRRPGRWPGH